MTLRRAVYAIVLLCLLLPGGAWAANIVHAELEPGATAAIQDGRQISLEVKVPQGDAAKDFLNKFLDTDQDWQAYRGLKAAGIPYNKLHPLAQRRVLEALFPDDYADRQGWWHTVTYYGPRGVETLFGICEWLTGRGTNYKEVLSVEENHAITEHLKLGQRILIPQSLLVDAMKTPSPKRKGKDKDKDKPAARVEKEPAPGSEAKPAEAPAPPVPETKAEIAESNPTDGLEDLTYGQDKIGKYAEYKLRAGETIYQNVIVHFTDLTSNADIQDACREVLRRSGLKDNSVIREGQAIRIPLDMLSDPYQPKDTEERKGYEAVKKEAEKLEKKETTKEGAKGLKGVLIVLDPGHGGRDKGASYPKAGLYEDELTYDIVCRLKKLLETKTQAKVYATLKDPNQGYEPSSAKIFVPDEDEFLQTTPPYPNEDGHISVSLRWYLANDIYRKALKAGTKDTRSLFLSIHCDAEYGGKVHGTMVYIPGAAYRRDEETPENEVFDKYAEARAMRTVKTTATQRQHDEAMSYNFANTIIKTLSATKKPALPVAGVGEPIRNVIRQKGGKMYVPAVLRNCIIPTKVLVETANLMSADDRKNLSDPAWRQAYAEALLRAINSYFGG